MAAQIGNTNLNNLDKSGWKTYRFEHIAKSISERVDPNNTDLKIYVGLEHLDAENIHIKRYGTPDDVDGQKLRCYPGDVIFGKRRAYQRKAALVDFDGFCSAHAMVLRANPTVIDPRLFPFFLHSDTFMHRAIDISVGSLSPTINWGTLKTQEFLLPPKDQQAKLAELLWAMDAVVEKEMRIIEKILVLENTLHKDAIDYGYGSNSKALPNNWGFCKIKDISIIQAGATPLRENKHFFDGGTIPWVKTLDLNSGSILKTEELITDLALKETSCKKRPINTVLVAMYGGFNQIGRTGLLQIEAATNQAISAIMVDESKINPKFLQHVLNAKIGYWKTVAISSRKDPNITKSDVENFPIPLPPLDKQLEIVKKINVILSIKQTCKSKTTVSKSLQKSLINQIF